MASFVSSAQTSDASVTAMAGDEYSDVSTFEQIKKGLGISSHLPLALPVTLTPRPPTRSPTPLSRRDLPL